MAKQIEKPNRRPGCLLLALYAALAMAALLAVSLWLASFDWFEEPTAPYMTPQQALDIAGTEKAPGRDCKINDPHC